MNNSGRMIVFCSIPRQLPYEIERLIIEANEKGN